MGIRSKLKSKLRLVKENVEALGKVIHDEAKHPGRPQPHMAARNPLWGGEDSREEASSLESNSSSDESAALASNIIAPEQKEESEQFWFLEDDGQNDDWSKVNPKER